MATAATAAACTDAGDEQRRDEDLAAVEGERGDEEVEDEQGDVHDDRLAAQVREEVAGEGEGGGAGGEEEEDEPGEAHGDVRERARDRDFEIGEGVAVVADVREPAEGPQEDLPDLPALAPRREAVPELVHEHGAEQHGAGDEERQHAAFERQRRDERQHRGHGDVRGEERVELHGDPEERTHGERALHERRRLLARRARLRRRGGVVAAHRGGRRRVARARER